MADHPYLLDSVTGLVLCVGAWTAWRALRASLGEPARGFWILLTAGLAYLTADEWMGFHEWIGRTLIRDVPLLNHPDDFVVLSYLGAAVVVLVVCRRELFASTGLACLWSLAAAAMVTATTIDAVGSEGWPGGWIEESAELLGAVLLVYGIRLRARLPFRAAEGAEQPLAAPS
jgi:hypothetical protein